MHGHRSAGPTEEPYVGIEPERGSSTWAWAPGPGARPPWVCTFFRSIFEKMHFDKMTCVIFLGTKTNILGGHPK